MGALRPGRLGGRARRVRRALESDPGDPEALDGLGQSLWWLGERDAAIERRREAYAAYQRRGDRRDAGRIATYLSGEHRIDGHDAEAAGWLARARRLLAEAGHVPERGWVEVEEAKRAAGPRPCRAPRARRARDRPRVRRPRRRVHGARAARPRSRAPGQRRGRRRAARRGDDRRARRRDERSARLRRRVLHHARRVRRPRRPRARDRVVRGRRRVHGAPPLHPGAGLVSRGLRQRAGARRRLGAGRAVLADALRAHQDRRRWAAGCCRCRCSPSCGCARGAPRRRRSCSTGSSTSGWPSSRSCGCTWRAATASWRRRCWSARADETRMLLEGEIALAAR